MDFIICNDYDELSDRAAAIIADTVKNAPYCTLGLATGSTPIGTYERLSKFYRQGKLDFSGITTFNLDEYYPIKSEDPHSYHYFMQQHLFSHINIQPKRINIPDGSSSDPNRQSIEYDEMIKKNGGIHLMLLGIGKNGHIGFNEPDDEMISGTHLLKLSESTLKANSRFFKNKSEMPHNAISMGMASIIAYSKRILLLANGVDKHYAVKRLTDDKITTAVPATLLKLHPDVTIICDKSAYYGD